MQTVEYRSEPAPVCSIVILAWHLTTELLACLASLNDSVAETTFEVIIVLNGANDEVRDIVKSRVTGATIVDIPHNVGFGGGCNAGAAVARGTHLVFLNDDTVVDPGWLDLLTAAASLSSWRPIGAVASVLLNPDGTVQEAGSRLLADRGTIQFGAGLSAADAERQGILSRREIDYGSGAALLVRTEVFRAIAGFDPIYEPAYYEDLDLQFRVKALGYSVIVEPSARVTHIGGGSTSDSRVSTLFREWAGAHSSYAFQERWATVLEGAPAANAPLDSLCPVPMFDQEVVENPDTAATVPAAGPSGAVSPLSSKPLPTAAEIVTGSGITASVISAGFSAWLVERLDRAAGDAAQLKLMYDESVSKVTGLEAELAEEKTLTNSLTEERDTLRSALGDARHRLHDLDTRGPIGLAKWRAALIMERRVAKRQ